VLEVLARGAVAASDAYRLTAPLGRPDQLGPSYLVQLTVQAGQPVTGGRPAVQHDEPVAPHEPQRACQQLRQDEARRDHGDVVRPGGRLGQERASGARQHSPGGQEVQPPGVAVGDEHAGAGRLGQAGDEHAGHAGAQYAHPDPAQVRGAQVVAGHGEAVGGARQRLGEDQAPLGDTLRGQRQGASQRACLPAGPHPASEAGAAVQGDVRIEADA
jgi:hypothetical protein